MLLKFHHFSFQWFGVLFVLLYRFAIAVFCAGGIIASGIYFPRSREKWFIYLSNWTFFFVTLYYTCGTIVTAIHYKNQHKQQKCKASDQNQNEHTSKGDCDKEAGSSSSESRDNLVTSDVRDDVEMLFTGDALEASRATPMRWFHQVLWVIYDIASVGAILVTISFWLLIYRSLKREISVITIIIHAVNSIVMIGDTMLSSIPVRLFHVVYPMLFAAIYASFTVIYWACGGTDPHGASYIYPQTDYSGRPVSSAVTQACMFLIGLPVCQSLIFGIHCLRVWIKGKM